MNAQYFVQFNAPFEGLIPWLYLDVRGLVTIGVGLLVDPIELADRLEMYRPDGKRASLGEVRAEWRLIKGEPELAKLGAREARKRTTLLLSDSGVVALVAERLAANESRLRVHFQGWSDWPHEAQLFAHSMAWAVGSEWPTKFPRCSAHLRVCDWHAAAEECTIREAGNPGIKPRNQTNRALLRSLTKGHA